MASPATPLSPDSPAAASAINEVLSAMLAASPKVSDLIFSPGRPPQVELNGKLTAVAVAGLETLTPDHTRRFATEIIGANDVATTMLKEQGSADTSYSLPGSSRFRVNIFMQRGTVAMVMRVIPSAIPSVEDLKLPAVVREMADLKNGIVLVTGPTGSGKSSTLAAIIDLINETHAYHIVTIEDPIEFMHRHKQSTIHQRELHTDTPSFALALRAALRQAPKVILVGEMRDRETIEIALEAAETGHLVFSTLHTIDASKTVERILGVFPMEEQQMVRDRLAKSFRWIMSQRLLPLKDGAGRVAVVEMLKSTLRTREYMQKGEGEGRTLVDAMRTGDQEGMRDFDTELEKLVRNETVELETALAYASNPGNLRLQLADLLPATKATDADDVRRRQAAARAASFADRSSSCDLTLEALAAGSAAVPDMTVGPKVSKDEGERMADLRINLSDAAREAESDRDFDFESPLGKTRVAAPEAEAFRATYVGEDSFRGAWSGMLVNLTALRARITHERESLRAKGASEFLWQKHADRLRYLYTAATEAGTSARTVIDLAVQRGLAEKVKVGKAALHALDLLRVEIVADLSTMSLPAAETSASLEDLLVR